MDICLPGMASRLKRAATSAMRPEPLVMTTKLTITRIVKTMMPMTKLPAITKLPNAWMTWPAASGPSWPWARMSRVDARLSERRSMVEISRTVGNAENSSGPLMNSAVIRIRTDRMIEQASEKSSSKGGSGRMRTTRIVITPLASTMSPRRRTSTIARTFDSRSEPLQPCADVTSAMTCPRRVARTDGQELPGAWFTPG